MISGDSYGRAGVAISGAMRTLAATRPWYEAVHRVGPRLKNHPARKFEESPLGVRHDLVRWRSSESATRVGLCCSWARAGGRYQQIQTRISPSTT